MTKLMVKVKNRTERDLTPEECCMINVSEDWPYGIDKFIDSIKDRLGNLGYIQWATPPKSGDPYYFGSAVFSTTEEREATPNECRAYYYLKLINSDANCYQGTQLCNTCIFNGYCIAFDENVWKSTKMVENKEFYEVEE